MLRINKDQTIEVTPTLIGNMLEQITYLQQMVLNPSGLYSPQSTEVKILEEDPVGTAITNHIENEIHGIDTINGVKYIRPIYGSFFRDSVVISNAQNNEVFIVDIDYIVMEVDLVKTRNTPNASGVYNTIHIIKPYVGDIKLTYQAYGGMTDITSIRRLHDRLWVIEDYLSHTSLITPATLPADPAIIAMRNKLQEIDGQMRLLLQNGLPSYGDVSTGSAVLKKITAPDQLTHWWSIATLYRVEGSNDNILSDVFKFRLKSLISGLMFECSVATDARMNSSNRLLVRCLNSNVPDDTLLKYVPRLRVLEVTAGGIYSGVILQLGMKIPSGILQETLDIEDMSGRESCWKLVPFDANSTPPEDTGILMPNGIATWAYSDSNSLKDVATIPFPQSLSVTVAPVNVAVVIDGSCGIESLLIQTFDEIDVQAVKGLEVTMVVNIINPLPTTEIVHIPFTSWASLNHRYAGKAAVSINNIDYTIETRLHINTVTGLYELQFVVTRIDASVDTLNITNIKLFF